MATAALKRRQVTEKELDRLTDTRAQLEMQVTTLAANLNAETTAAMKKASDTQGLSKSRPEEEIMDDVLIIFHFTF